MTEHARVAAFDLAHMVATKQVAAVEAKLATLARAKGAQAAPNCFIAV